MAKSNTPNPDIIMLQNKLADILLRVDEGDDLVITGVIGGSIAMNTTHIQSDCVAEFVNNIITLYPEIRASIK